MGVPPVSAGAYHVNLISEAEETEASFYRLLGSDGILKITAPFPISE